MAAASCLFFLINFPLAHACQKKPPPQLRAFPSQEMRELQKLFCGEGVERETCGQFLLQHAERSIADPAGRDKHYLRLLHAAAETGLPEAQFKLALHYEFSDQQEEWTYALELFENLAKKGDTHAAYKAGYMYQYAPEPLQDIHKAFAWYTAVYKSEDGYYFPNATAALAHMYAKGEVVPKDPEKALSLCQWTIEIEEGSHRPNFLNCNDFKVALP